MAVAVQLEWEEACPSVAKPHETDWVRCPLCILLHLAADRRDEGICHGAWVRSTCHGPHARMHAYTHTCALAMHRLLPTLIQAALALKGRGLMGSRVGLDARGGQGLGPPACMLLSRSRPGEPGRCGCDKCCGRAAVPCCAGGGRGVQR